MRITPEEYQDFVKDTCYNKGPVLAKPADLPVYGAALELVAEVGEVMEILQKASRKRGGWLNALDREDLADELGDVLWGLTAVCNALGVTLGDLMEQNRTKLMQRIKDFS